MKNMIPDLLTFRGEAQEFLEFMQKLKIKAEQDLVEAPKTDLFLFKEDFKRVEYYRDRMMNRALNSPIGKRRFELESLANTLSYMLEKFDIRDLPRQ